MEAELRRALTGRLGGELGREVAALAYGWEHWERVQGMDNPTGYLYQVGLNHFESSYAGALLSDRCYLPGLDDP